MFIIEIMCDKYIKYLIFIIILLTLLSSFGCKNDSRIILSKEEKVWLKLHPEIKVAPDPNFAPVEFFNEKGQYSGIGADYIELIEKKLGINFNVIHYKNWNEVYKNARNKNIDVLPVITKSPERSTYLLFTKPYIPRTSVIIVRNNMKGSINLKKLRNKKIALVSEYVHYEFIKNNYPDIFIKIVPDIKTGLTMVSFGEVDAMVNDLINSTYFIEKEGIINLRIAGKVKSIPGWSMACRNDSPELQMLLIKGLESITDKEKREIYKKWVSFKKEPIIQRKEFWSIFLIIVVIFIVLTFIINIQYRKILLKRIINQKKIELIQKEKIGQKLKQQLLQTKKLSNVEETVSEIADELNKLLKFTYLETEDIMKDESIGRIKKSLKKVKNTSISKKKQNK